MKHECIEEEEQMTGIKDKEQMTEEWIEEEMETTYKWIDEGMGMTQEQMEMKDECIEDVE